jgi:hypothetical protein
VIHTLVFCLYFTLLYLLFQSASFRSVVYLLVVVVSQAGGVETDDGRTLFGFDAEVYERLKAKEDPELERAVGQWIEDVLDTRLPDTCNLFTSLKSGVVLCQYVIILHGRNIERKMN